MNIGLVRRRSLVLLGAVAFSASCSSDGSTASRGVQIGAPVPNYSAVSLAGDSVSLEAQRGKVVLLNIWATWCHPCRAEIPELRAIRAKYQPRGFELLGVSVDADGSLDAIQAFARDFKMEYPIWLDPGERIMSQFMTFGVPETFLIDRKGVLRWRKMGPIEPNDSTLSSAIERALAS
jgi:cytochrome c biogenesis protein CcmG, thiol:disulfide interchange protein DsbE